MGNIHNTEGMQIKTGEFSEDSERTEVNLPLLPVQTWTEVKVEKKTNTKKGSEAHNTFQISINGTIVARRLTEKKTRIEEELKEVKVYASAPGRESQPGKIRELTVEIAGNRCMPFNS